MSRPEDSGLPADLYYGKTEAKKYSRSSRMAVVQTSLAERALELLALPEGEHCLLLDIGCGTGMSGSVLEDNGHTWIGTDLSESMLQEAFSNTSPSVLLQHDMGTSLPFRPGVFDGAISISAVQWLFSASNRDSNPRKRISTFFRTLHSCLSHGSRAVLQLYATHSPALLDEMTRSATRAGFSGGLVVDFPHSTRAKKSFLVLQAGGNVSGGKGRERKTRKGKVKKKSKEWILAKKERQRRQGLEVRADTKYTARKRRRKF